MASTGSGSEADLDCVVLSEEISTIISNAIEEGSEKLDEVLADLVEDEADGKSQQNKVLARVGKFAKAQGWKDVQHISRARCPVLKVSLTTTKAWKR